MVVSLVTHLLSVCLRVASRIQKERERRERRWREGREGRIGKERRDGRWNKGREQCRKGKKDGTKGR